ncbi:MAG: hypothetical protein EBY81_06095, partial [Verrucomicrobia bacterium]|nr:hypothetical protein [Verrucomicrobiota bacterium]
MILIRYDKVGADLPTHFFSLHRQVIPPLRTIKRIILKMQREEIMKKCGFDKPNQETSNHHPAPHP